MNLQEWTMISWQEAGGLVNKSFAARYLQVSHTRINQLIKTGNIREFAYSEIDKFVSFNDLIRESKNRRPEYKRPKGSKVAACSDVQAPTLREGA